MVGFIIPLKPKQVSGNWQADIQLLENTVASLLQQTDPLFKIYIVYTDLPPLHIGDERIRLVKTPYPFLKFEEMSLSPDVLEFHKSETMIEKRFDKGKKLTYGSKLAKEDGCSYLMGVDSDDLLSDRLVAFVASNNHHHEAPGWYIDKGYVMKEGEQKLLRQNNMHYLNGSTHILRADLVDIPDDRTAGFHDYSLFTAHGWIKERLAETKNVRLKPLPFRGVIYMIHRNNISGVATAMSSNTLKQVLKNILRSVPISRQLQAEFNLSN